MSNQEVRRALDALRPGADEHPGMETLEAYVEGRLSPAEKARVDALSSRSAIVAEDLADLQAVHESLATQPVARRDIRWGRLAVGAAIAATILIAVLVSRREPTPVDGTGTNLVAAITPVEQARVDLAAKAGRIALPASVAALVRREGTLLGAPAAAAFGPLSPVGTAVRSPRPAFSWSDAGADAYTVAVFDANFAEIARSDRVRDTSWTPAVDLPRATPLVWQVTAHRQAGDSTEPKPPKPEARFSVLDAATAARVEEQAARLAGHPLALGVLLAEVGLISDARAELTRAANDATTAAVARQLLASLDSATNPR